MEKLCGIFMSGIFMRSHSQRPFCRHTSASLVVVVLYITHLGFCGAVRESPHFPSLNDCLVLDLKSEGSGGPGHLVVDGTGCCAQCRVCWSLVWLQKPPSAFLDHLELFAC